MRILALDTTTRPGSHALWCDDGTEAWAWADGARVHAERLPAEVLTWLGARGLSLRDIDALAVAAGPGSFTGLRIGIACMQGLAFATGLPIVGVSALEALAEAVAGGAGAMPVAVWMDGQRGEVFAARYRIDAGENGRVLRAIDVPVVAGPARVAEAWAGEGFCGAIVVGDGADRYRDVLADYPNLAARVVTPAPPVAPGVARLAARRLAEPGASFHPHAIMPLYVRRPDAELARDARGSVGRG